MAFGSEIVLSRRRVDVLLKAFQVVDLAVGGPFKSGRSGMKQLWEQWMMNTNHVLTETGNIRAPVIPTCWFCSWRLHKFIMGNNNLSNDIM